MAKQEVIASFKLMAPGGQATPAPPLGPVLGANGVNPGQFVQQFNDRTRELNGKVVGVVVTVFADRTFKFEVKSSPTSVLLKQAAGVEKGAGNPLTDKVGKVTDAQVEEIAKEKLADLNTGTLEGAKAIVAGQARSMGIEVEG